MEPQSERERVIEEAERRDPPASVDLLDPEACEKNLRLRALAESLSDKERGKLLEKIADLLK